MKKKTAILIGGAMTRFKYTPKNEDDVFTTNQRIYEQHIWNAKLCFFQDAHIKSVDLHAAQIAYRNAQFGLHFILFDLNTIEFPSLITHCSTGIKAIYALINHFDYDSVDCYGFGIDRNGGHTTYKDHHIFGFLDDRRFLSEVMSPTLYRFL